MGDWGQQPPPGGFGPPPGGAPGGGYPPPQSGGFPPPGGAPPPDMRSVPKTDPLAIVSLVLSVVAALLCCIPCVGYISPVLFLGGIGTGAFAITRINKDPMLTGKGLAIAGIAVGGVFLVLWLVLMVLGLGSGLMSTFMQQAQRH